MPSSGAAVGDTGSTNQSLAAPYSIEFPFHRTAGPKVGTFLGGLREARLFGVRAVDGSVLCPVLEFDPDTAAETGELVPLEPRGTVRAWTFARGSVWALINIDGTGNALFHTVDAEESAMHAGMRVRVRWRAERVGAITDIECFEPEEA
ncbi:DNA-binding protein [Amycolatopsis acidicola]|uniref:DNA-binding protein n=1 Tax=Amycolatopsis acidicola TaxID=2596893 RepID=A0A5N0V0L5_9PSEU|nr:DNA-binding protein [Amycolatopsis acidicola]KAA9156357.1 DNA-binding protein [Amycolatopsis acidicola]